jgi:hypothetical protein
VNFAVVQVKVECAVRREHPVRLAQAGLQERQVVVEGVVERPAGQHRGEIAPALKAGAVSLV